MKGRYQMTRLAMACALAGATATLLALAACDNDGSVLEGQRCEGGGDCVDGCYCWNDICVKEGALEFSLVWTGGADLDLYVETPSGETLGWNDLSAAGGHYSVYDCWEGDCVIENGNHVEHSFFPDPPEHGVYEVFVDNYDGMDEAEFTIEVREDGSETETFTGYLPQSEISSDHYTYDYQ